MTVQLSYLVLLVSTLINTIKRTQRNWIGHLLRGETWLRTVIEGSIPGKRQ